MDVDFENLERVEEREYIKMIHRMQPFPLYNILYDNGFQYKATTGTVSAFDIYIWKASDKASAQVIQKIISG